MNSFLPRLRHLPVLDEGERFFWAMTRGRWAGLPYILHSLLGQSQGLLCFPPTLGCLPLPQLVPSFTTNALPRWA